MATLADYDSGQRRGTAPVSAHPAFPAIVALWFAALLGLGSLVLPTALLERLTEVTGLATLVPSAAAPLGFTARASIAIGGAILGAVLGLVLARQVASGQAPRPRARFSDDIVPRRAPISAHEELGEEGIGVPEPRFGGAKRRSLAIAEDDAPSRYLKTVPLPGHDHPPGELAGDALDLGEFVDAAEPPVEQVRQDDEVGEVPDFEPSEANELEPRQEFVSSTPAGPALPRAFDPLPEAEDQEEEEEPVDALQFAPPSLRRAPASQGQDLAPPRMPQAYEPDQQETETMTMAEDHENYEFDDELDGELNGGEHGGEERPLDQLGLVQLATRLGSAIERRRAMLAAASTARPAPLAVFTEEEDFDAAEADEAARARADFFGAPAQSPPAAPEPVTPPLRSEPAPAATPGQRSPLGAIEFGEDDDSEADDLAASFSLPLRNRSETATWPMGPETGETGYESEEEEDPTADQEYSSLLAMKNPFLRTEEFVRVEEPEPENGEIEATVSFPERKPEIAPGRRAFDPPSEAGAQRGAPAPGKPGDAERELRAALETLQRMSGAA